MKKINSSFLRVKENRNVDYDKDICNTGLFEGHSLLLCYMHIYENLLFLYLSYENTYMGIIYVPYIVEA